MSVSDFLTFFEGNIDFLIDAVRSKNSVQGFTHNLYKYPAQFSPQFARAVINLFTKPGDTILDPFVGGGTTLVEANILGRHAIGADINPLAVFVTRAKTTPLTVEDIAVIEKWAKTLPPRLNLRLPPIRARDWHKLGYQKYLPWPIRKTLEFILVHLDSSLTANPHFGLPRDREALKNGHIFYRKTKSVVPCG